MAAASRLHERKTEQKTKEKGPLGHAEGQRREEMRNWDRRGPNGSGLRAALSNKQRQPSRRTKPARVLMLHEMPGPGHCVRFLSPGGVVLGGDSGCDAETRDRPGIFSQSSASRRPPIVPPRRRICEHAAAGCAGSRRTYSHRRRTELVFACFKLLPARPWPPLHLRFMPRIAPSLFPPAALLLFARVSARFLFSCASGDAKLQWLL